MAHKVWVVTSQSYTGKASTLSAPVVVEHISARKKIAFIDDYLCDLYEDMLDETLTGTTMDMFAAPSYDDEAVRACLNHPSGTEVILDMAPFYLRAVLQSTTE